MRFCGRLFNHPALNDIVHVDALLNESPKSIKKAWLRFHQKHDSIASVLETASYDKLLERTQESPMFVFPLPVKEKGFRSVFFEARGNVQQYTDLESYKRLGPSAPSLLVCVFYPDLRDSKGLVLMRGRLDVQQLSPTDAAFLANQTAIWYFDDDRYKQHVWTFNNDPKKFDFDKVVDHMQRL